MKILHAAGQAQLSELYARAVAEQIRRNGLLAAETWERLCRRTREEGFGAFNTLGEFQTYRPYLEQCVEYYPTASDLDRLAALFREQHEQTRLEQLVVARGDMLISIPSSPFALEVHRPVEPHVPQPGLPELPAYVPREHDAALAHVVTAAAAGTSGIAVLVGGSSTGKTRACWEALALLRDQDPPWRLWHPIDPSRPDAALRELPGLRPRTVVWLNEAQFYLDTADGMGARVAAGLRELLCDRSPRPSAGAGHPVAGVLGCPDRPPGRRGGPA